jgi:excisionase family DNA binding protein
MEKTARRFLKIPELADALNCSRSKAYELTASGAIKSVLIAGLRRVPIEELDRIASEATAGNVSEPR